MRKVSGSVDALLMECVHPVKGIWCARFAKQNEGNGQATYMEEEFSYRPSEEEIRDIITQYINQETDRLILSGYQWEGNQVWLSSVNQLNYKAAYDLAVQTGGKNLPVRFKFGTDESPVYCEFRTLEELEAFYTGALSHIQRAVEEGWQQKDNIDLTPYRNE